MNLKAGLILMKTDLFPCSVVIYIDHMKLSRFSMLHGGQTEFLKNYNLYSASSRDGRGFFPQKFWKKYLHHLNNLVKPFPKQFQFQDLLQNWKRYRSLIFFSFHVLGGEIVTTF